CLEIPQAYLMYGKGFLGNMMENLQADCVQSRQAGFTQCFPIFTFVFQRTVALWIKCEKASSFTILCCNLGKTDV
ncbi:MAG TPA: hypothetical protein DEQ76_06665, partial [Ruminococcus sp.]|nr:hypothetical protein [Ruminococcus sp.]